MRYEYLRPLLEEAIDEALEYAPANGVGWKAAQFPLDDTRVLDIWLTGIAPAWDRGMPLLLRESRLLISSQISEQASRPARSLVSLLLPRFSPKLRKMEVYKKIHLSTHFFSPEGPLNTYELELLKNRLGERTLNIKTEEPRVFRSGGLINCRQLKAHGTRSEGPPVDPEVRAFIDLVRETSKKKADSSHLS